MPEHRPRDEDLSPTDSFNLLFVVFGLGLVVLVGWNLFQRWSAPRSVGEPTVSAALAADAGP